MSRISTIDLPFLVECTVFTTQDVNAYGKISVKVNAPYRLHVNFITYRFLKVPWQGEQGLEDRRDPCVSKSVTFSRFFFYPGHIQNISRTYPPLGKHTLLPCIYEVKVEV